jgi:hypothetical protein
MRYLCRFHPCSEILIRFYEIFETSKKQDLTPFRGGMGYEVKRYINQPKTRAPTTMRKKRERAYFI